ncbi:MAG TPA: sulfatase [Cyclobacteriaceae bacterium]|nr:sulfatase [Cyclobacteriaceae bacterium]
MRRVMYLFIATLMLTTTAQCQTKDDQKRPPNVIIFLIDDLGWSDIACYGSSFYETPNLDKLAKEGARFTNAYAACHVCSPSRASILSGKYPARMNLTDWLPGRNDYVFQKLKNVEVTQHLPNSEVTLAKALKDKGYNTAIIGKWHLGEAPNDPTQYGFDMHIPKGWSKGWPLRYDAPFNLPDYNGKEGEYLTDKLTDEALNYIESTKDKPFFLYFSHFTVHDPIEGRADLVEKYKKKLASMPKPKGPEFLLEGNPDNDPLTIAERETLLKDPAYKGFSQLPRGTVKIKQHQDNVQFAGMVESMDESMGRVMNKLKELGLSDNTIIIFASDNGGMSGANFGRPDKKLDSTNLDKQFSTANLPLRGAKGWMYEGGIRIALIVKWSGVKKPGSTVDLPVIHPDLYPSILEMAGFPAMPQQHVDGKSFAPVLKGEKMTDRPIFWHFPHYSNHGMQSPGGGVRYKNYKLLEYYENNTVQLFDLDKDIGELNDISKKNAAKVKELTGLLHQWRKDVGARMMPPNPDYKPGMEPWTGAKYTVGPRQGNH